MIGALSFVPIADTVHTFTELSNHVGDQEQVILDYFETHTFWNVNTRVQGHLPRTNNHLEGWHNRFAQIVEQFHPHIWKFTDTLKKRFRHQSSSNDARDNWCRSTTTKTNVSIG